MSQASAISLPFPVARPLIKAIDTTGTRVRRTSMSGQDSSPVGPVGIRLRSSKLARKSLWFRKKPSTALSKTTTLTCSSSSMAVTMSLNSWTNCGPITLSGGLSNVIRQQAEDDRLIRICAVLVVAFI
jgi:hypothetical protein